MLAATAMVLPPELKAHFPQPPCVFCAGDSTSQRYPGTSLPVSLARRLLPARLMM